AHIAEVWSQFRAEQVYKADSLSVIGSGARWRMLLGLGRFAANWMRVKPRSLLDNSPLAELLQRLVQLDRLPQLMKDGHVQALAVTASS
ncbi:patatin-like phospholipase family protein, partial [Rhizobium sp. BGM003]|nr:patatin-like phospholipase family protein [Rhizobium phaseoli]